MLLRRTAAGPLKVKRCRSVLTPWAALGSQSRCRLPIPWTTATRDRWTGNIMSSGMGSQSRSAAHQSNL